MKFFVYFSFSENLWARHNSFFRLKRLDLLTSWRRLFSSFGSTPSKINAQTDASADSQDILTQKKRREWRPTLNTCTRKDRRGYCGWDIEVGIRLRIEVSRSLWNVLVHEELVSERCRAESLTYSTDVCSSMLKWIMFFSDSHVFIEWQINSHVTIQ